MFDQKVYNDALSSIAGESDATIAKYLRKAEYVQSTGEWENEDTWDLAVNLYWKDTKNEEFLYK